MSKCALPGNVDMTWSSPRRPLFLHSLSFECTEKLCISFLNQLSFFSHLNSELHNLVIELCSILKTINLILTAVKYICAQFCGYLRTLPPLDVLNGDSTRNCNVLKYNSYGVNFWQKRLVYQEGISRIILLKLLFLADCIVWNQQL